MFINQFATFLSNKSVLYLFSVFDDKGGFFSKVNEFEFPAKIKPQIVKNWRILKKN